MNPNTSPLTPLRCDLCGKYIPSLRSLEGMPDGVSFVTHAGEILTYCTDCIMKIGAEHRNDRNDQKGRC